jgi:hypothetical protein
MNGPRSAFGRGRAHEQLREPLWPLLREVHRRLGVKGLLVVLLAVLYHTQPDSRLARITAMVTRSEAMRREALTASVPRSMPGLDEAHAG